MKLALVAFGMLATSGVAIAADSPGVSNYNPWWAGIVGTIAGAIFGAVINPAIQHFVRRRNRPILSASIEPDGGSYLTTPTATDEDRQRYLDEYRSNPEAILKPTGEIQKWFMLRICNTGRNETAARCRGTLLRIDRVKDGKREQAKEFTSPQALIWSGTGSEEREVLRDIPAFLCVCFLRPKAKQVRLAIGNYPLVIDQLFNDDGEFFLHILLSAGNADAVPVLVRVNWNKAREEIHGVIEPQ